MRFTLGDGLRGFAALTVVTINNASLPTVNCSSAIDHQTSLTAGTIFESTKLPLTLWFQGIYLITQDKKGISDGLACFNAVVDAGCLHDKIRFAIREGGRTVGAGVVSKIFE